MIDHLAIEGLGQREAFGPARRAGDAREDIRRGGRPVDALEHAERCDVIARPSQYDRVVAEDVLAAGLLFGERTQCFKRLCGAPGARFADRAAIGGLRAFISRTCASAGEDEQACRPRYCANEYPKPLSFA